MVNALMMKNEQGYKQTVTINGEQVEYSLLDLQQEAERSTLIRGTKKGYHNLLPSVDRAAVLRDIVKLRGITADTLFQWLMQQMKDVTDYGADSWQEVKENCEGEFYVALAELDELKALFHEAVKEKQYNNKTTKGA